VPELRDVKARREDHRLRGRDVVTRLLSKDTLDAGRRSSRGRHRDDVHRRPHDRNALLLKRLLLRSVRIVAMLFIVFSLREKYHGSILVVALC